MDFPHLETERLSLGRIAESDVPDLFAFFSDPEVMRFYDCEAVKDHAEMLGFVRRFDSWFDNGTGFRWGLRLKGLPAVIGTCGLFYWHKPYRVATLGYELARAWHRKGIMSEALAPVIAYGFGPMGLNRIGATVHTGNAASIALLEALGFRREGLLRQAQYVNGRYDDLYPYALLREEWKGG